MKNFSSIKKATTLLICTLLCLSLIGDGNLQNLSSQASPSESTYVSSAADESENESEETTADESTADAVTSTASDSNDDSSDAGEKNTAKTTASQKDNSDTTTAKRTTTKKSTTTTAKSTSTTKKETTTSSTVSCTVTIECKSILSNMDSLKDGHEAYVPSDGIILDSYTVTVKNGATAYDALKQACSANSITINAESTSYGVYIAGFNNIDEKDCGGGSGWLYYINGSMPNKTCAKYTVKNGDSIVFSYTC